MATFPSIARLMACRSAAHQMFVAFSLVVATSSEHSLGFNQNPKVYNLTFEVSETDADTIEAFLDARAAVESFNFTPPGEGSSSKIHLS
jgi:hypothetical protein